MSLPRSPLAILILFPALACTGPATTPPAAGRTLGESVKPQAPEVRNLNGTLNAETIRQIAAFKCEMTETQASLTQSVSTYLSSRDEEPYEATQSRIDHLTILTVRAKGMSKERAEALMEDVPRGKVLQYGWDKVILANNSEGWIFDMSPSPQKQTNR